MLYNYCLPGTQQSSKCAVHCTWNLQFLLQRRDPSCPGVSEPGQQQCNTAAVQSMTLSSGTSVSYLTQHSRISSQAMFVLSHVLVYVSNDPDAISLPLQGALYCLLGNHSGVCLANLHDWDCIALTWPAIVRSGLSSAMSLEKPSIVRLFDDLADKIHRQYETIGIDFSVRATVNSTFL